MSIERTIVQKLFESKDLYEAEFTSGGSTYKCAFGKYYKDSDQISREEYFKAKETGSDSQRSSTTKKSEETPKKRAASQGFSDSSSFSDMVSTHAQEADSKMKKDKNGPYFYDSGDKTKFSNAVGSMAKEFSETHSAVSQYQISKSQSCYYDEESGMAIVIKNSDTPGKSWVQMKKLSADEVAKLKPVKSSEDFPNKSEEPTDSSVSKIAGDSEPPKANIVDEKKFNKALKHYNKTKDEVLPGVIWKDGPYYKTSVTRDAFDSYNKGYLGKGGIEKWASDYEAAEKRIKDYKEKVFEPKEREILDKYSMRKKDGSYPRTYSLWDHVGNEYLNDDFFQEIYGVDRETATKAYEEIGPLRSEYKDFQKQNSLPSDVSVLKKHAKLLGISMD